MRKKPAQMGPRRAIVYNKERWEILSQLRAIASGIMLELDKHNIASIVHGSIARGDVTRNSDVDVFIPYLVKSFQVEFALSDYDVIERKLEQATPLSLIKAHLILENNAMVTFPVIEPQRRELEFYKFGGAISLPELKQNKRVAGVDKRLMLIEPSEEGHVEIPLRELSPGRVAKILGVSQDIVEERLRVLQRRAEVGRTGVYLERVLSRDESFETVLSEIASRDPAIRRRINWMR
ncbi:MAG: nucleotidyltransferase domain-containing protein [Methanocellales archaeon]